MRTTISCTMLSCILLTGFGNANAQTADEEAIKKVIQEETNSFFHKDYDKWAATWEHDSAVYIMRAGSSNHSLTTGWTAISSSYKDAMNGSQMDEESIAPYLVKTDYHIFINGNMAVATFKEGTKNPSPEARTMVKQNGAWKILNMSILDNSSYILSEAFGNMKAFVGKWEYESNSFTVDPNDGGKPLSGKFELRETPNGLEQISDVTYSANNQTYVSPTECEYFIPDYNQNEINYIDIQRNNAGQTFTAMGKVTSDSLNSYTVKAMYPDKPNMVQTEYTVTLKDGKWHQVAKTYGRDGKVQHTYTLDLHRL